ncbi:MAG: CPBP family intramembrane metalloprotease [Acidobacteriota bacterium]|nr:CPBP family intramembrane metalloprotease [Acidobacteriota bacterium]
MSSPFQPVPDEPLAEPTPEILTPARPPAAIPRESPVFGLLDVFLVFTSALFLVLIVPALAVLTAHSLPRYAGVPLTTLAKNAVILVPGQTIAYLLLIAFVHMLMIARYDRSLAEAIPFAWPRERWVTLVGAGVALAFAILLLGQFLPIPKQLPIDEFFKTRAAAFVMLAFGVLVAPLVEELLFRGLLYPVLNRHLGVVAALVLTSLGFALLHASQLALAWAPLLSLFLVGFALTLVRARFQSVAASTLVHMAYNATLLAILYLQTGGFRNMDALTR